MKRYWKRYAANKAALVGLAILLVYLFLAVFADVFFDREMVTYQDYNAMMDGISADHWFGTDELGRDLFVRMVFGARTSLMIGFAATLIGMVVGSILGALCAYLGGVVDQVIMRVMDVLFCIPFTLLAMLLVAMLGKTAGNLILAVSIANTLSFAKTTRGNVLSITEQDYIKAARLSGVSTFRIIVGHILPNTFSLLITNAAFTMATSMLAAAALSFLGVGVQPPEPEWGAILAAGKAYIQSEPRLVLIPSACIVLATLSITLVGEGLRDAFDPRQQVT